MVKLSPDFVRYCSAFRFHSNTLPLPSVFKKFSFCVPPMLPTTTNLVNGGGGRRKRGRKRKRESKLVYAF